MLTLQGCKQFKLPMRKWRNWQTHQLEGLTVARPWGFESPLPHQPAGQKSTNPNPTRAKG